MFDSTYVGDRKGSPYVERKASSASKSLLSGNLFVKKSVPQINHFSVSVPLSCDAVNSSQTKQ